MTEKDINTICWWIPFKNTRDAVKSVLHEVMESNTQFNPPHAEFKTLKMHASDDERGIFFKHLINSNSYLEFGSGGSTFEVLNKTNSKVISIESDINFINKLLDENEIINKYNNTERLKFYYVDIGKIKGWGYPIDDSECYKYPDYSKYIFTVLSKQMVANIDTVFIDGRFRVACVLSTLLNCNKSTKIIIHDFFNREHYHVVLNYLNCIDRADTLGVFTIKENIDLNEISKLLEKYQYILG